VQVTQTTRYPWDGAVRLRLDLAQPLTATLHLRVPGWCESYQLALNGAALDLAPGDNGYLALQRTWRPGDELTYVMDMPIRPVWAHGAVRQLQGRVALQRGPLVYCLEGVDHDDLILDRISIDPAEVARAFTVDDAPDLLGGVAVIRGHGQVLERPADEPLYSSTPPRQRPIALTAIPYCLWGNRAPGEMRVWVRAALPAEET
jgi:DUF1680 family protein